MGNNTAFHKRRSVLSCLLFMAVLTGGIFLAARLVERKESEIKNGDYFDAAEKADVLLLGSSHMINGINPAVLYEDYGIAAYNLGGHGNTMQVTYWEFVNALDYGMPDYVIIDTYLLEKDYQYLDVMTQENTDADRDAAVDQLHEVLDVFPLTKNKWLAIQDLISSDSLKMEFVFDFIRYHSRWSSLEESDYEGLSGRVSGEAILGAEMRYEVETDIEIYGYIDSTQMMEEETIGKAYLRRIIEICIANGITPVIVQIPFAESGELQAIANSAQKIADEYGIAFINMNYVEDIIDPQTDQQSQTHLNVMGAAKATAYLGQILSEVLLVPDHRAEEGYEIWEEAVENYHRQLLDNILNPNDLYTELLMLEFDEVSAVIFINNNSVAFDDSAVLQLVEKLSGTKGIYTMADSNLGYCLVIDPATQTREETTGEVRLENIVTSFGAVNFTSLEDYALLTVGDDLTANVLDYVNDGDIDVQILIYNPESGEQIAHLYFDDAGLIRQ